MIARFWEVATDDCGNATAREFTMGKDGLGQERNRTPTTIIIQGKAEEVRALLMKLKKLPAADQETETWW